MAHARLAGAVRLVNPGERDFRVDGGAEPGSTTRARTIRPASAPAFDDGELVAAVHEGDPAAAVAFHERLRPVVEGAVRREVGREQPDTEDLVQSAMLALAVSVMDGVVGASLEVWASSVTTKVVGAETRRRRADRRVFAQARAYTGDEIAAPTSAARALVVRDLLARVAARLAKVSAEKVQTVYLHDACGFDLREIAQLTNATMAAAQTRLVRGRVAVRRAIAGDPELASALVDLEDD